MADRPMIFSAPMIRALIREAERPGAGKTQTRRIIKPAPPEGARYSGIHHASNEPDTWFFNSPHGPCKRRIVCGTGDRIWVREGFTDTPVWWHTGSSSLVYAADVSDERRREVSEGYGVRWRPSIHMRRWLSRLTLTVKEVRVERLRDISERDALCEGMTFEAFKSGEAKGTDAKSSFAMLWDEIHGEGAWKANPFIVALTFAVTHANIDSLPKSEAA